MFKISDTVKLKGTISKGIITGINKEKYTVRINDKDVITTKEYLEKIPNDTNNNSIKENINKINVKIDLDENISRKEFNNEIMIRHQTLEEAMFNLDEFVKEAIYNDIKEVRIIHGKHGGILRKAVHEYLKGNKNIESFRLGNYFEGSYGVTIAKLK